MPLIIRTCIKEGPYNMYHICSRRILSVNTDRPRFIVLHFTVLCRYWVFLQIEGLWQPCIEQVYWRHFSNSICSLHVSVPFW